ncbi:hypothetical protein H101_01735 [Trichophyton interdigitale H6]|nr:hypothetical protein H101_01735 [Trichophyton interdigitale H6]
MTTSTTVPAFTADVPTLLSITAALSIMPLSYLLGTALIPSNQFRNRLLFFWHAYDAGTHLLIEGSFLYHCFFSYKQLQPDETIPGVYGPPYFLNRPDRAYGPAYGVGASARMWQEYGKADARWLGADLCVVCLEILTVLIGGPLAVYICYLLTRSSSPSATSASKAKYSSCLWFSSIILAVGELYGGFMTFGPEWFSGSVGLETSDPVYLWLYLVFFNVLWVIVPLWVISVAWGEIKAAFATAAVANGQTAKKLN